MEVFVIIMIIVGILIGLAIAGVILRILFWFLKTLISLAFKGAIYVFIIIIIVKLIFG